VESDNAVEPAASFFNKKVKIRRTIEAEEIPYTYVCSYGFFGYYLSTLGQQNVTAPPRDKVVILGNGNVKGNKPPAKLIYYRFLDKSNIIDSSFNCLSCAFEMSVSGVYVSEEDVGTYTIKAVDDQRTLNKILYLRPPANVLTFNQLVSLWEKKIKSTLEKVYIPEDQILKNIQGQCIYSSSIFKLFSEFNAMLFHFCCVILFFSAESPFPANFMLAICHAMLVKDVTSNHELDPSFGVEASEIYPEVKYTTADNYLNAFV